ncbi:hypothetical protein BS47DRAFT_1341092 [Hydnum rufescens UP504]|uniref:Uncharacterized protein n=1 Tax=Hydnum rufescens UP504 TaxID=1448309 RepID=A0A9P6B252_9AGAM|nr:hypothetical protein BS47DRAFT_1341092 [Hydnum rufescens UP504]
MIPCRVKGAILLVCLVLHNMVSVRGVRYCSNSKTVGHPTITMKRCYNPCVVWTRTLAFYDDDMVSQAMRSFLDAHSEYRPSTSGAEFKNIFTGKIL